MIDPGLKADIHAEKPWTMSPLLCAMNIFAVSKGPEMSLAAVESMLEISSENLRVSRTSIAPPPFVKSAQSSFYSAEEEIRSIASTNVPSTEPLKLPEWHYYDGHSLEERNTLTSGGKELDPEARKKYFLKDSHRKNFVFHPKNVYEFDFYNKYLDLHQLKIRLPGFTVNMTDYWSGFPIRYVCRSKDAKITFFVMELELV